MMEYSTMYIMLSIIWIERGMQASQFPVDAKPSYPPSQFTASA